ncbi:efflux RND transporter periplasmic adaptor subunit [Tepidimonas fonticaldi]|uniref:efflux RND transporter periplasmic adaptor subunit n=1 Tax=Tepidimonas fonticaldi TaxID=1101373 RepID=UPI001E2C8289|nr:efflux RND transporter periplasmic adaptor subunit [Tepidimonas fonticaldi]
MATGRVAPARETTLASTLTGRVVATPVADGVLLARLVEVGDGVTPGKALLRFAVAGTPRILLDLDERDLGALAVGQPAAVRADAWPDQRIAARCSSRAGSSSAWPSCARS